MQLSLTDSVGETYPEDLYCNEPSRDVAARKLVEGAGSDVGEVYLENVLLTLAGVGETYLENVCIDDSSCEALHRRFFDGSETTARGSPRDRSCYGSRVGRRGPWCWTGQATEEARVTAPATAVESVAAAHKTAGWRRRAPDARLDAPATAVEPKGEAKGCT